MKRKIKEGLFSCLIWTIILFFLVLIPYILIYFLLKSGENFWISPLLWIAVVLMLLGGLIMYLYLRENLLRYSINSTGITVTYLGKIYKKIQWEEIVSAKIINIKGNVVYYIALIYGEMDKEIISMSDVDPLKKPCVGFLLTLGGNSIKDYPIFLENLGPNIIEDSKAAREWTALYNRAMNEKAKKEAKKAERKRLREYK